MRKIKNLILTFLLMFIGVVSASALSNEEMEDIKEKFWNLRLHSNYFQNDEEQFYYFEETSDPNVNLIVDYITRMFDYTQYILNPDEDYNATGETIKFQVPKGVFEAKLEETFVVNNDFYTELHNNFRPSMSNESSGYKEIEGSYYYYYELYYGMGTGINTQPFIKGYKDLGNNQYQVYFYDAIEKEYAGDSDLMNESNVYITRKNYADEDTEYLVLGYLTSKIEYKNGNVKYLSYEEVDEKDIPSDIILYEEEEKEEPTDKEETPSDKEESKEEIEVSDKTWRNFLNELSKNITDFEYGEDYLEYEFGDEYISTFVKYNYKNGILTLDIKNSKGELIEDSVRNVLTIVMKNSKYGEKISLISSMLEPYKEYGLNNTFTLKNDGIEYVIKHPLTEEELKDFTCTSCHFSPIFESFSIDLKNGLNMENLKKFHKGINAYKYLDGEDQKINTNEEKKLTFRIDADFKLFDKLYINGEEVDKKYYTVTEGSTIITFNEEYTNKMSEGEHTMKATFTDGKQAITEFVVEKTIKNPNTGIALKSGILILIVAVLGVVYLLIRKQRKFPIHN